MRHTKLSTTHSSIFINFSITKPGILDFSSDSKCFSMSSVCNERVTLILILWPHTHLSPGGRDQTRLWLTNYYVWEVLTYFWKMSVYTNLFSSTSSKWWQCFSMKSVCIFVNPSSSGCAFVQGMTGDQHHRYTSDPTNQTSRPPAFSLAWPTCWLCWMKVSM